ncbi:MAG: hypothetical protein GC154_20450 [bacterium]|nr:hypothetical protein [bacterium]
MKQKAVEDLYTLSPSQRGMLFQSLAAPRTGVHVEQSVFLLEGSLDRTAMFDSWKRLMARHPVLRTAFAWEGLDEPVQAVLRDVETPLEEMDWRSVPDDSYDATLQEFLHADRLREFRFQRAPLFRLTLLHRREKESLLVFTWHHILLDGWSLPILFNELFALYQSACSKTEPVLPSAVPYKNYIRWIKEKDKSASETFWRTYLRGFSQANRLGVSSPPIPVDESADRFIRRAVFLPEDWLEAMRGWTRERGLTLSHVMRAAWAIMLGRYSERDDIVFGATVSGRPPRLPGAESIVGLFINSIPIRLRVDPGMTVETWLGSTQQHLLALEEFSDCSAGEIHSWSEAPQSAPLYESLLVFQNYPAPAGASAPNSTLRASVVESQGARTAHPLTWLIAASSRLEITAIADRRRLPRSSVETILCGFEYVLRQIVENPGRLVEHLVRGVGECGVPEYHDAQLSLHDRAAFVAPRTLLEIQLAQIWMRLLGVDRVSVHDDFFLLGGHSLLVARLTAEIESRFRKKIPLSVFLHSRTLEAMAAVLSRETGAATPSPMVLIQPGGEQHPLFCVHPLGGHVVCYVNLARRLGGAFPVYGLQAMGMNEGEEPFHAMPEMAAAYLREIRQCQPRGPYRLAGYSFGAYVAVEIARLLIEEGEPEPFVAMLDAPHPAIVPENQKTIDSAALLYSLFYQTLNVSLDDLRGMDEEAQLRFVLQKAREAEYVPEDFNLDDGRRYLRVCKLNHAMAFSPREHSRYPGRLTLFSAREKQETICDKTMGWAAFAEEGVEVIEIPGSHETLLDDPHAATLARELLIQLQPEQDT